jgi:BlaI family transcriptional regulator, penicillinase repressor
MLRILEDKGCARHREQGRRYIYSPCVSARVEGRSAFQRVLQVFFGGSLEQALAAHLSDPKHFPDADELERLRMLIDQAEANERHKKMQ